MKAHLTEFRMTYIKNLRTTHIDEDVLRKEPSFIVGENAIEFIFCGSQYGNF